MKKILFIFSMLLAMGLTSACSTDNEKEKNTDVSFTLLHENGNTSDIFDKNEVIVFSLSLKTSGNPEFTKEFDGGDLIVDDNLFAVFNENGMKVGQPNMERIHMFIYETAVGPYVLRYNWSKANGDIGLPPGNYYTRFTIKYNTEIGTEKRKFETKEYIVNFKIKE